MDPDRIANRYNNLYSGLEEANKAYGQTNAQRTGRASVGFPKTDKVAREVADLLANGNLTTEQKDKLN